MINFLRNVTINSIDLSEYDRFMMKNKFIFSVNAFFFLTIGALPVSFYLATISEPRSRSRIVFTIIASADAFPVGLGIVWFAVRYKELSSRIGNFYLKSYVIIWMLFLLSLFLYSTLIGI